MFEWNSTKAKVLGGSALFVAGMATGAGIMYACSDKKGASKKASQKALAAANSEKSKEANDVVDAMVSEK